MTFTLEKRFAFMGITLKVNVVWKKKQRSNLNTLCSYADKSENLLFEKSF